MKKKLQVDTVFDQKTASAAAPMKELTEADIIAVHMTAGQAAMLLEVLEHAATLPLSEAFQIAVQLRAGVALAMIRKAG